MLGFKLNHVGKRGYRCPNNQQSVNNHNADSTNNGYSFTLLAYTHTHMHTHVHTCPLPWIFPPVGVGVGVGGGGGGRGWVCGVWGAGGYSLYEGYYICFAISTPLFRFLESLYTFDPYILPKMRKMLYFDPYFSEKLGKMYSFDPPPPFFFTRVTFRVDEQC